MTQLTYDELTEIYNSLRKELNAKIITDPENKLEYMAKIMGLQEFYSAILNLLIKRTSPQNIKE